MKKAANPEGNASTSDSIPAIKGKSGIFEFTGSQSKKVVGVNSGRIYYFRYTGHRMIIPYEDSFGMMGERDLKVITSGT